MLVQIYYFHSVDAKHKNGDSEEYSGHWDTTLSKDTNMYRLGLKMEQSLVYHPNESFISFS